MLEKTSGNPFCRLAEAVSERRARAVAPHAAGFTRPFWLRGLVPESLLKNPALRRWWERLEDARRDQ